MSDRNHPRAGVAARPELQGNAPEVGPKCWPQCSQQSIASCLWVTKMSWVFITENRSVEPATAVLESNGANAASQRRHTDLLAAWIARSIFFSGRICAS